MTLQSQIIHKRINPALFADDADPRETELLKWFRMMPLQEQEMILQEVQLIGYSNMVAVRNDEARRG